MSIKQISEAEQLLATALRNTTEVLKEVTAERDKLAAELKSLRDSGVELPEPKGQRLAYRCVAGDGEDEYEDFYTLYQLRDYGDRRAMAERERCAKVCAGLWRVDGQFTADEFADAIRKEEQA